jgi:phosphatidylinositol alpha-1,6-mannosyltransferase
MWELYRRFPRWSVAFAVGEHARREEFDAGHSFDVERLPLSFPHWGLANWTGLFRYAAMFRRLSRFSSMHAVRRWHCGKCLPEGLLAWFLKKWRNIPYACYVHGEELTLARLGRELTWHTSRVLKGADFLVANSNHTRDILVSDWKIPLDRVRLLHPGVDTARFVPSPRSNEVRERLGWTDRTVLLTAGALQKRKGQDMMIRALKQIREQIPDILYSIVGEGWERRYLLGLVKEEGVEAHVQFRGVPSDDELIACYQQCDLFALPNRQVGWDFEGFGMVLLEAQACGRPVLAGRSGGTADTMREGETGRLADCTSPELLGRAVVDLLADKPLLLSMGEAGRRWVEAEFDWSVLCEKAAQILDLPAPHELPEPFPAEKPLAVGTAGDRG